MKIEIKADRATFGENPEAAVARILNKLSWTIEHEGFASYPLMDIKGSTVGRVEFVDEPGDSEGDGASTTHIKEVWTRTHGDTARVSLSIRDNFYGSQVGKFAAMLQEAKADLPQLDEKDVKVVMFGGSSYKGTYGIVFVVDCDLDDVPDCYTRLNIWHEFR